MADPVTPVPFDTVLEAELRETIERRRRTVPEFRPPVVAGDAYDLAHEVGLLGAGLSGGGIRSATFNLGILQGLAKWNLLPYLDYLSTVSGGGYIGTWLHGVIRSKHGGDPRAAMASLLRETPGFSKDDPVTFLRKYSNYLAPRWNLLSTDAWVIACIWLRNMLLNLMILVPFLAATVTLALILRDGIRTVPGDLTGRGDFAVLAAGLLGLVISVSSAVKSLGRISARDDSSQNTPADDDPWPSPAWTVLGLLVFGWCMFPLHNAILRNWLGQGLSAAVLFTLFILHQWSGGFKERFLKRRETRASLIKDNLKRQALLLRFACHIIWMPALSAAATLGMLNYAMKVIGNPAGSWPQVVWGPPLLVAVICLGATLHIGLMGADFPDDSREWLARIAAVGALVCFGWMTIEGLSVYGPYLVANFAANHGPSAVAILVAWGGSILSGLFAASSARSKGNGPGGDSVGETLLKIVPVILMLGILLAIAYGCHAVLLRDVPAGKTPVTAASTSVVTVSVSGPADQAANVIVNTGPSYGNWFTGAESFAERDIAILRGGFSQQDRQSTPGHLRRMTWEELREWPEGRAWLIFLVCAGVAALLPVRVNINEFSMHHFYKNRLVRCYLGAGHARDRKPNPFTGFDPKDDFSIALLCPSRDPAHPYCGPYPIVNTTLNINAGAELATQERKANSFVFTPLYCGFRPLFDGEAKGRSSAHGYVPTEGFYAAPGPRIGTAMAISGAAANPNWGYHTSAPVAFLLTMFNVRLGWWAGNPRVNKSRPWEKRLPSQRPGPRYGLSWLLWELLGQTTDHSAYVNLSDGGHFENLGLYELVRRRCRYIIIGDGEQDPNYTFESLGGAIRKCRADFGVEIDIEIDQIRAQQASQRTHCVVGTIKYPERTESGRHEVIAQAAQGATDAVRTVAPDQNRRGWILYLKASLTGDEPEDVTQYRDSHADFPQETTMNQFFTESQFESYRRLGLHVVESALADVPVAGSYNLEQAFQRLAALWYGEPEIPAGVAAKHNDAYSALLKRLADDPALSFLDDRIMLRTPAGPDIQPPLNWEVNRRAFFFLVDMIQLMENVWSDLAFDRQEHRNHPKFQGWVRVFQHWSTQEAFKLVWARVRTDYNPLFQDFVDEMATPAAQV